MTQPLFISFATPSYKGELQQLVATMYEFRLSYCAEEVPDLGSWDKNTRYKAEFIKRVFETSIKENECIVWLDADARVQKYPQLLIDMADCSPVDVAAHMRKDRLGLRIGGPEGELLSGTLFMRKNVYTMSLLDRWIHLNNTTILSLWEQKNLQQALEDFKDEVWFDDLPAEYCMITAKGSANMGPPDRAIIAHLQASRRLKNK